MICVAARQRNGKTGPEEGICDYFAASLLGTGRPYGWYRPARGRRRDPDAERPGMPEDELRRYIEVDLVLGDDSRYRRKYDMNMGRTGLAMSEDEAARLQRENDQANRGLLRVIRCPTLLVAGARSDILLPEVREEMLSLLNDVSYFEIDADHWVFQEKPREFADAVLGFLATTP